MRVDEPNTFRTFVQSGEPIISQIRRVMVHTRYKQSANFPANWEGVLNAHFIGRLLRLEGVHFSGLVCWSGLKHRRVADIIAGLRPNIRKMSKIIRSFQQHKLKEELTIVNLKPRHFTADVASKVELINERIRRGFLQHRPRRLSKRDSENALAQNVIEPRSHSGG